MKTQNTIFFTPPFIRVQRLIFQFLFILSTCVIMFSCGSTTTNDQSISEDVEEDFEITKGTNISHWLSQSQARGEKRKAFFTETDVARIAEMGFDHLRIPIDEEQMWDEAGNKNVEAFELLHNALKWCDTYKLNAIVDLHILRSHHFNDTDILLWESSEAQERFLQCWRELSGELSKYPNDKVAYELLNEPNAKDPEDLNKLIASAVAEIRILEPERFIVIGSNDKQKAYTFADLRIPENDRRLILSFHLYDPMLVTHYKASWVDIYPYEGPVHYPGMSVQEKDLKNLPSDLLTKVQDRNAVWDKDALENRIIEALKLSEKTGLKLYCGEFGAKTTAPSSDRARWYTDVCSLFKEKNIAYANWDYKSTDFGIVDNEGKEQTQLISILSDDFK